MASSSFEPCYLALHRSGELRRRAERALEELADCCACPRDCHVDRLANKTAVCKTGRYARVASYFPHRGEEDCLRGRRGSGTIFFAWCNLRCVFCQNFDISQQPAGVEVLPARLADMMLELQAQGCHNINFVTPEHVVPQILEALPLAVDGGLRLPLLYNTSGYDALRSLRLLDGIVDIYMPDFKMWDPALARKYLKAEDYPEAARKAIREMHRQVGDLVFDESGLARRGLLVRHLVMPGGVASSAEVIRFLAEEISPKTYINVMDQYRPAGKVGRNPKYDAIARRADRTEYETAAELAREAGLRIDAHERVR